MPSEAEVCIAELDAALAGYGEDIRLQRMTTGPDGVQIPFEVKCRAAVTDNSPQELIAVTGEAPVAKIILSPTQIARAQWPGPPRKDDRVFIQGGSPGTWRPGNVEVVSLFSVAGRTVRIELQCRGFVTA